jgi:hypothetical protein
VSTYVREKVLRIPRHKMNFAHIVRKLEEKFPGEDVMDDLGYYIEDAFPDLFDYGTKNKFQLAPTVNDFIDYVLDKEWDCEGSYGKIRDLYDSEKEKFRPIFQQLDPDINMDYVRLVEFCWYNGSEAPDYYDLTEDPFYKELT